MAISTRILAVALGVLAATSVAAHQVISLETDTPPENLNEPVAISADGEIVVGQTLCDSTNPWCESPDGPYRYFWTEADGLQPIDLGYDSVVPLDPDQTIRAIEITQMSADGSSLAGTFSITRESSAEINIGFHWNETDGFTMLSSDRMTPRAITPDGSTLVGYGTLFLGAPLFFVDRPFRWTKLGGLELLSVPNFFDDALATLVSDDGSVVVGYVDLPGDIRQAFRWTDQDGFVGLGTIAGVTLQDSRPTAMTPDGSVVVGFVQNEGFRWTESAGMQRVDPPAGWRDATPADISNDGTVMVGELTTQSDKQAFRWTAESGAVGLGYLPGGNRSEATFVSADGSVVIGKADTDCGGSCPFFDDLFIWTEATGMQSLRGVLADHGITGLYDSLLFSRPINIQIADDGRTIVFTQTYFDLNSPYAETDTGFGAYTSAVVVKLDQIAAEIDVFPLSATNDLDPEQSGLIDVAVLGLNSAAGDDSDFDVTQIDTATLRFGPGAAQGVVAPVTGDVDSDGNTDLSVGFSTLDVAIACEDTEVLLTGETMNGDLFKASDMVVTDCEAETCH